MADRVREELVEFIVDNFLFGDEGQMPGDEVPLADTGVVDSTGILELIEFLESHFAIEVTEAETVPQNLGSVANLTRYVRTKSALATR